MSKQKRKPISLKDKIDIINDIENGMNRMDVINKYKLANYQNLTSIMKNKEKYITAFCEKSSGKQKKLRGGKFKQIEAELMARIEESIENNIPITGTLVQDIAKDVAKDKNILDFKASNGWLCNYKKRESLSTRVISGESNSVSEDVSHDWIYNKLPKLLEGYDPKDIFNCDEFGLFYKMMPKRSLSYKGKQ